MSSRSEGVSATEQKQFHHDAGDASDGDGCWCPIHRDTERDPFTAPLGLSFADHIRVKTISREQAGNLYKAHHGYMSSIPNVNFVHHGATYQRQLVGAITYRYPLLGRKRLYLSDDGTPLPEPRTEAQIRSQLPEQLHSTALDTLALDRVSEGDIAEQPVVDGDRFAEAARICMGVRMPNLASSALARSQEVFVAGEHCPDEVEYLLTFVRSDYSGTMVRALRDKGWTCVGWTRPSQAGNREDREIRQYRKWVFVCPVETVQNQSELSRWSG